MTSVLKICMASQLARSPLAGIFELEVNRGGGYGMPLFFLSKLRCNSWNQKTSLISERLFAAIHKKNNLSSSEGFSKVYTWAFSYHR